MTLDLKPLDYKPPGPVARAFLKSDAYVRGLMGPFGSGKSTACVMDILRRALMQAPGPDGIRRSRWAVVRNTYPELTMTTIKTWHEWISPALGSWRGQGPPRHLLRINDMEAEVLFVALDRPNDVRKLMSLELTGAWLNEARYIEEAIFDGLTARVGRYPAARDGGPSWYGIIMDTNPPDTDHWYYKRAEVKTPVGFEFFRQPGGLSEDAENLQGHTEGRGYYNRLMRGKAEDWIKVHVHGEYGFVQDGKPVFPEYVDSIHCRPADAIPGAPLTVGLDFGLTPAAVIGQRDEFGRWRILRELVATDMGTKRFAQILGRDLRERFPRHKFEIWGDPAGDQRAQTDETTPFQILEANGVPAWPAPSNDVVLRLEAVRQQLNRMIDGAPGIAISPDCPNLRKGMMGAYRYRRLQMTGSERYHDVPDKNQYSHVCDALQYMLLGAGEGSALVEREEAYRGPVMPAQTAHNYDPFNW